MINLRKYSNKQPPNAFLSTLINSSSQRAQYSALFEASLLPNWVI